MTALAVSFRNPVLAWVTPPEDDARFRRINGTVIALVLLFGLALPWLPVPDIVQDVVQPLPPPLAKLLLEDKPLPAPPPRAPEVRFDNDATHRATIIEVHATDGIGVLNRITRALAELDLDIRTAKVQTLGDEVVDAFYVLDAEGAKITELDHQGEVRRAVLHALR